MARILELAKDGKEIRKNLARSFQSGRINFLIGSGATLPAIPLAGTMENDIALLLASGREQDAALLMYEFLSKIQVPTNKLIREDPDVNNSQTSAGYAKFLGILEIILAERRTTLLPKQATIFTTNYDLFFEKASVMFPGLKLNDGFTRVPSIDNKMSFSSRNFFNVTYNTGNLYDYKVEVPSINVVKLHGSFSWKKDSDEIIFQVAERDLLPPTKTPGDIKTFIERYAVVLPQAAKFRTTLLDRTYYDLLRIYANELDRENSALITFGFSFGDEHILDITKRSLKNPTLRLIIFAFDSAAAEAYGHRFDGYNNVEIIGPPVGSNLGFEQFNEAMMTCFVGSGVVS